MFSFESASRSRLSRRALSDHDLAFITNFNALSEREVGEITDWVADGGHVVLGMGDATDASAMSQTLAQIGIGTADRVITSRASFGADAIVGDVDWRHPVFNAFAEAGGVILRPRFRKYLKVEADSSAVVIGSYDSGDPFVIEKRVGSGSIIVYTSSINNDWTDFPIDELFVPFLYQLGNYAVESAYRQIMFEVGDVVALPGDANDPWEVRVPSGDVYRVSAGSADVSGGSRGFFRQTEQPGQYLATRGTERLLFSVNVNSSESDLAARNVDEAYAAVVSPFVEQQATQRAGAVQIDDADNQELWHFFLALAIILLVIETVLSHARSSTPGTTAPDIVMTADKRKRL